VSAKMTAPSTDLSKGTDGPGAVQSSPDPPDLSDLLRTGAVFVGVGVTEVRITLSDGRRQMLQLPTVVPSSDGTETHLTPMQRDVLQVVDGMGRGEVMSFEQLATKAGWSNSDNLRVFVRSLADVGRLKPSRLGWEKI
jgi:hypothetical protein